MEYKDVRELQVSQQQGRDKTVFPQVKLAGKWLEKLGWIKGTKFTATATISKITLVKKKG